MDRTAVCSCGQLSVTVSGDPAMHGICSCLECQKTSGSAFSYSGYWPNAAVQRISGRSTVWRRSSDSGRWADTYFCPVCGSTVYGYSEFAPDAINISIGNFAAPDFAVPSYAGWCKYKHAWVEVPASCEVMDTQP
jgi:hypothetical protein